jgi:hypothetical protein
MTYDVGYPSPGLGQAYNMVCGGAQFEIDD